MLWRVKLNSESTAAVLLDTARKNYISQRNR